ncbi:MAG TPA: MoxR family ATPase [Candidatus Binatia bacterium]|nr:MoxR family ATPase [Candidatus Binatia bacterium]
MPKPSIPDVDVDALTERLRAVGYLADRGLATALSLAAALHRPLLLEGDAGVGKTEAARALALAYGAELVRLQCYEGIDVYTAVYDWNYGKQLLAIRTAEASSERTPDLYGTEFLIRRPLLAALDADDEHPIVLLIDEIDRADDEFEAFLLEFLADYAITIPELGRVAARVAPTVVLTSNRTRDLHDALKRRCFYHWIEHPSIERTIAIMRARIPELPAHTAESVARAVAVLRSLDLRKPPGVAEALDWAASLGLLHDVVLDEAAVRATLGAVVKYPEDIALASANAAAIAHGTA